MPEAGSRVLRRLSATFYDRSTIYRPIHLHKTPERLLEERLDRG